MKKYFVVTLIFLAACSNIDTPAYPMTAPDALNLVVAQTAQAASMQTAMALPPTLTPTPTPFPTLALLMAPTARQPFVFILPTPTTAAMCPFTAPYYVRVRPFAVGSKNWENYIPNYPQDNPYGYPATLFLQYIQNTSSWITDTEYINLSNAWMNSIANLNGSGWNYLHNASDGTFFGGNKLGVDTFPGNVLLVTGRRYRRGECWDTVSSFPYSDAYSEAGLDLIHLPPYQLGLQTGMNYSTPNVVYPAPKNGGNIYIPIISRHGNLWIEDFGVEAFPALPMDITVTVSSLNIYSDADTSSTMVESVSIGKLLQLTDYSPMQRVTFGQVTDPANGKTGYISLFDWSKPSGSYNTTWTMQTLPVPPG
jgi:hypothetical protein